MLDHIEQCNDVDLADAGHVGIVGNAGKDVQAAAAAIGCSLLGQFDARDVVIGRCLVQKKTVGASEIEEPSLSAILADQLDAACKLAPEYGLSGRVVRIAVAAGA